MTGLPPAAAGTIARLLIDAAERVRPSGDDIRVRT